MKIHEYQAKAILARYGVPVPRGEVAFSAHEVDEIARRLGSRGCRRQGADSRGRSGQGGRRQGRQVGRRRRGRGQGPARADARDLSDRAGWPEGIAAAAGGGPRHRPRAVPEHRHRSLHAEAGRDDQRRGRRGHRRGGGEDPEKIHKAYVDPGIGLAPFQAQRLAFAVGLTGDR